MTRIETRISGSAELDKVLRALPKKMGEAAMRSAVLAGATVIRKEARLHAPIVSGQLVRSIISRKVTAGVASVTYRVGTGGKGFYGAFLEFGTASITARPFLTPAFESKKGEARDAIGIRLGKRVEAEAKKLAGNFRKSGQGRRRRRR